MKRYILFTLIILLLLLTACTQAPIQPICNKPYIIVGTSCCLDQNNNNICDSDEPIKEAIEVKQEIPIVEPVIEEQPATLTYTAERIIDGDTFVLSTGEKVRLIGIDTPETYEDYYSEAKSRLEALILGESLTLEKDISETDRYGRLLRYVYIEDSFINLQLVAEGYAEAYPYPPDVKYKVELANAEEQAKQKGIGIWQIKEAEPITQSIPAPQQAETTSGTICSRNAYNCGDFSSQSAAQRVFEACGGVSNDIHILDKDKDGVACESLP